MAFNDRTGSERREGAAHSTLCGVCRPRKYLVYAERAITRRGRENGATSEHTVLDVQAHNTRVAFDDVSSASGVSPVFHAHAVVNLVGPRADQVLFVLPPEGWAHGSITRSGSV